MKYIIFGQCAQYYKAICGAFCEETVRKAVIKLGYRVKKKSVHASEQERSRRESKAASLEGTQVKSSD